MIVFRVVIVIHLKEVYFRGNKFSQDQMLHGLIFLDLTDFCYSAKIYLREISHALNPPEIFSQFFYQRSFNFNPLSSNPEKLSNTLKQIVGNLPTICLSVFDHFMNMVLKGLNRIILIFKSFHYK